MKLLPQVYKHMKLFFHAYGFVKKRGTFYKIENNLAFCISFEKPSDTVYVWFHLIPLYIPTAFPYFTYGRRIKEIFDLPRLTSDASEEYVVDWCQCMQRILSEEIFPFYEKISSPAHLLDYIDESGFAVYRYLFCGPWCLARLRVYTCLYLRLYNRVIDEVDQAKNVLRDAPFTDASKNSNYNEMEYIASIALQGSPYADEYLSAVSENTFANCF